MIRKALEASVLAPPGQEDAEPGVRGGAQDRPLPVDRRDEFASQKIVFDQKHTHETQFWYVTLPLLKPVILIVTIFSVIFTFADFQLVYVLTRGGPANATQLFATYAFDIAMSGGQLGRGASVALAMLPILGLLIIALTAYTRSRE